MLNRRLPAVASAVLLSVAGAAMSPATAHAGVDCTPAIKQSSVHFTPKPSAMTSKGMVAVAVTALISAPCGNTTGTDLVTTVDLSPVDIEHIMDWTVSSDVMPAGAHTYKLSTVVYVKAAHIDNADAGAWDGGVGVIDTDDADEWGLTTYSDLVPFTIKRASAVSANATPEPVKKGKTITVRGTLTRASWDAGHDRPFGNRPVQLQFRTPSGTYKTLNTAQTSATGKVQVKVKATKDGYYRLFFPGTSTTAAAKSKGDYVNVK